MARLVFLADEVYKNLTLTFIGLFVVVFWYLLTERRARFAAGAATPSPPAPSPAVKAPFATPKPPNPPKTERPERKNSHGMAGFRRGCRCDVCVTAISPHHGKLYAYSYGCRCVPCKAASAAYQQERRKKIPKAVDTPPKRKGRVPGAAIVHGHVNSYWNHNCRCSACKEAMSVYQRANRGPSVLEMPTDTGARVEPPAAPDQTPESEPQSSK